MVGEIY